MDEIQRITDKVAIFKDGHYVTTVKTGEVPESEMIRMMVGRDLGDIYKISTGTKRSERFSWK